MPRHVNHDDRRARIEDAVIAIAAESGFGAVTVRAVASHIGASTSVVTHYVDSRETLLCNAVRRELDRRRAEAEAIVQGLADAPALRALIEWAVLADDRTQKIWLALVLGAATEPALRAELDVFNDWWRKQLRKRVTRLQPADPVVAGDLLDVLVDGLIVTAFDAGHPWPAERRARLLDTVWNTLGF